MMRRKMLVLVLSLCLLVGHADAEEAVRVGLCLYNGADTFITSVSRRIASLVPEDATLLVRDAANDCNVQAEQVETLLRAGVDALIVNPVDRTAALYLIDMAKQADVPVVFINREPLAEDMARWARVYYVGTDPEETGRLCGELAAEYLLAHPEADKSGDGVIQYVLLRGETGHQDAEGRTGAAIRALQAAGFRLERLGEDDARWERALGQEKMTGFLNSFGGAIECVLSNNDDMALGAIDALKAAGWFSGGRTVPVVGVDATDAAIEAVRQGTLVGTVLNDADNLGSAAWDLAYLLARGQTPTEAGYAYEADAQRRVYLPSQKITASTLAKEARLPE